MRTLAVATALLAMAAAASAGTPRLQRVLLLPVAGRVSVVLEMSGAPASVTSRRVSGDLVEVDAGPVEVDHPRALTVPAATPLVSTVFIDSTTSGAATLRARITLREAAESAVRIQGTRVYIDISGADAAGPSPQARAASVSRPRAQAAGVPMPPVATADDAARAELQSTLDRFGELLPFLTSAASAPTPEVLAALAGPASSLDRRVKGLMGGPALRPAQGLLASAIAAALKAADANYRGDRIEQVRQAALFFDQAKREAALIDSPR